MAPFFCSEVIAGAGGHQPRRSGYTGAWEKMPLRGCVLMAAPRRARVAGGGFRGGLRPSRKRPASAGPLRAYSARNARFHKSLTRPMPPGSGQSDAA